VVGILFHIGEKKIPGSVGEPTADGRSPVRTLSGESKVRSPRSGTGGPASRKLWTLDLGLWTDTRDGTRGKKVAGGTSGPGGSCKNRSRRDGTITFNIRGECQTGPAARGGWRSDAGAWSKVPERPARSGHGTGHVVSPRKLDEFGPHPNPLPPEAGGRGGKTGTGPRSRDGKRLAAGSGLVCLGPKCKIIGSQS
jgi:hypothetical protein